MSLPCFVSASMRPTIHGVVVSTCSPMKFSCFSAALRSAGVRSANSRSMPSVMLTPGLIVPTRIDSSRASRRSLTSASAKYFTARLVVE